MHIFYFQSGALVSTKYSEIRQAILDKKQVIAMYNGYRRELCPHVIGLNSKGQEQCLFYQFGGESSSGTIIQGSFKNWRCIPLDKLEVLEVLDGEFHTASNHSRRQSCVKIIDVEVEY